MARNSRIVNRDSAFAGAIPRDPSAIAAIIVASAPPAPRNRNRFGSCALRIACRPGGADLAVAARRDIAVAVQALDMAMDVVGGRDLPTPVADEAALRAILAGRSNAPHPHLRATSVPTRARLAGTGAL